MARQTRCDPRTSEIPTIYLLDPSPGRTGAFVCARNVAKALKDRYKVVLVMPRNSVLQDEDIEDFAAVIKVPLIQISRKVKSLILFLPYLFASSVILARNMRKDGVRVFMLNEFFLMHGLVCRFLGFQGRILTWVRIDPSLSGRSAKVFLKVAGWCSSKVIAVSLFIQSKLPPDLKSELLYDSIQPDFDNRVEFRIAREKSFVFIGNYMEHKGQHIALEALSRVVKDHPDVRLDFHGGDFGDRSNISYRAKLEKRAENLGITQNVSFNSFARDVPDILTKHFAALNMSKSESFSMTVLEASACGLPVIATRSGGPEEIVIDGKTGFLIPVGDVDACAQAIARLCRDRELAQRLGYRARQLVHDKFSFEKYRESLLDLLDSAS